jgi:ClpP class serine protease
MNNAYGTYMKMYLREGFSLEAPRESQLFTDFGEPVIDGDTAIIPVTGTLGEGWNPYSYINYFVSKALNMNGVNNIILSINSPGGAVAGLFDTCRFIEKASKKKKCTAYVTGMACSAAYAIATACDEIYMMEDAEVGSCGCYAHAVDYGESYYEKEGFIHRVFRSKCSPKKNCSVITDDEEAKAFQAEVDALGEKYLKYVAKRRKCSYSDALANFGQGGVLNGEAAMKAGMVDGIKTLEELGVDVSEEESTQKKKTAETTHVDVTAETENNSPLNGGEGDDMDINAMSEEQRREFFTALCSLQPDLVESLVKEAKEKERVRILSLRELRNGSAEVDAIVDSAVADGREAQAVAVDIVKAMKSAKDEVKDARKAALNELADDTHEAGVERYGNDDNPYLKAAEEMNKEIE